MEELEFKFKTADSRTHFFHDVSMGLGTGLKGCNLMNQRTSDKHCPKPVEYRHFFFLTWVFTSENIHNSLIVFWEIHKKGPAQKFFECYRDC